MAPKTDFNEFLRQQSALTGGIRGGPMMSAEAQDQYLNPQKRQQQLPSWYAFQTDPLGAAGMMSAQGLNTQMQGWNSYPQQLQGAMSQIGTGLQTAANKITENNRYNSDLANAKEQADLGRQHQLALQTGDYAGKAGLQNPMLQNRLDLGKLLTESQAGLASGRNQTTKDVMGSLTGMFRDVMGGGGQGGAGGGGFAGSPILNTTTDNARNSLFSAITNGTGGTAPSPLTNYRFSDMTGKGFGGIDAPGTGATSVPRPQTGIGGNAASVWNPQIAEGVAKRTNSLSDMIKNATAGNGGQVSDLMSSALAPGLASKMNVDIARAGEKGYGQTSLEEKAANSAGVTGGMKVAMDMLANLFSKEGNDNNSLNRMLAMLAGYNGIG